MRIAFVDLLFSWPPHGGGDVDVYHVAQGAQRMGHEICMFAARDEDTWERGRVGDTPFPVKVLSFSGSGFTAKKVAGAFREAVDAWRPDVVYVGQGFLMKPAVTIALAHYPIVSRFHAHEVACHKDMLRFLNGRPCEKCYFDNPKDCRRCAFDYLGPSIRAGKTNAWIREYVGAEVHLPGYYEDFLAALRAVKVALVCNAGMVPPLGGLPGEARVIPSGVDAASFVPTPFPSSEGTKVILMAGRAEDPAKGFEVLAGAATLLWEQRHDFEVWATLPQDMADLPWLKPLGWVDHAEMHRLYSASWVCVVPSIWEEPWGLVAIEAMASGRPVCASRIGGLADIVVDGKTGLFFEAGNAADLTKALSRLLDAPDLCKAMGRAGRERVETEYAWEKVNERYYRPLWEKVAHGREGLQP